MSDALDTRAGLVDGRRTFAGSALANRLLNAVLFVAVLLSFIAFVEPSPHDALMMVLLVMCVAARIPFDRKLVPLLLLLMAWVVGVFLSSIQVSDNAKDIQYAATSLYLAIAALTFACIFSDGNLVRLSILRRAYLLAALVATAAGYIGYFHLLPGANIFLAAMPDSANYTARISATFKDPNVYGPFLIFPVLMIMIGLLAERITFTGVAALVALTGGLFLSFSRGAWGHFIVSAAVCYFLLIAVSPHPRVRARIVLLGIVALAIIVLLVVALLSINSIHDMFLERAKALQPYDVGPGGRFSMQQLAPGVILAHPFGLGPFEFYRIYGLPTHNSYLQGFLVYGWLGGTAYLTLVVITLLVGLPAVFVKSPWQFYLLAAYAAFVGEAGEGLIVDTEHWRHFFLLLGLIWGLTVANINLRRRQTRVLASAESAATLFQTARLQGLGS